MYGYYNFILFTSAFKNLGYEIHKINKHNIFSQDERRVKNCMNDLKSFLKETNLVILTD